MSDKIQKITDEIFAQLDNEKQKIIRETQKRVTELEKQSNIELNLLEAKSKSERSSSIEIETKRSLGQARIKNKMELLNEKEQAVQKIFNGVQEKLLEHIKGSNYPQTLLDLVVDAGLTLEGGNLVVQLRSEDKGKFDSNKAIAKLKEKGKDSSIKIDDSYIKSKLGGVIVRKDQLFIDNTFEAILDRENDVLRSKISKSLFNLGEDGTILEDIDSLISSYDGAKGKQE